MGPLEVRDRVDEFSEQVVKLNPSEILSFCGQNDSRIRELEAHLAAKVVVRGNEIKILGAPEDVQEAADLISQLIETQRRTGQVSREQFRSAMRSVRRREPMVSGGDRDVDSNHPAARVPGNASGRRGDNGQAGHRESDVERETAGELPGGLLPGPRPQGQRRERLTDLFLDAINVPHHKRLRITPLTPGQQRYTEMIRHKDIVFGIGPAGTGKTYLAMAMAVSSLVSGSVSRIILVRPAVEAGERLGFLPGDIAQKFDPYVRPLWDALYEMMEGDPIKHAIETGVIEIAPLAFMRGRTLNNSFVILDEAQNTTVEQMKMFLTRLGFDSKAVVTGDVTQIDLPTNTRSGLVHVQRVLKDIDGIGFVFLKEEDVVRHELVQKIIRAYERSAVEEAESRRPHSPSHPGSHIAEPPPIADAP